MIAPLLSSSALLGPITSLIELRIWAAWPSRVGLLSPSEDPLEVEEAAMGVGCGGAGILPPAAAVSA